jgi:hypothetical protein
MRVSQSRLRPASCFANGAGGSGARRPRQRLFVDVLERIAAATPGHRRARPAIYGPAGRARG